MLLGEKGIEMYSTDWCITETGAAGPTGNGYGDPAGYSCFAISGGKNISSHVNTNSDNRFENMVNFSSAALELFLSNLN